MYDKTHIQPVAKDFTRSREREREPTISGTFIRLNVLDNERAEQGNRLIQFLISYKLIVKKRVACNCVSQAVIVIIVVVSVKLYSGT